jgi:CPA1 family monovalent cation:H+ antiporter
MLGRRRARARQPEGRLLSASVYDVVVFVLENGIFAVIGLELASFLRDLPNGDRGTTVGLLAAVTAALLLTRGAALALPLVLPRTPASGGTRRPWRVAAVVTWAGARGVIPLAAALSIPTTTHAGTPFPHRSMLLVVATGVVVITLVVQGTTLGPLVRRLGVMTAPADDAAELLRAQYALAISALDHLEALAQSLEAPDTAVQQVRSELQRQVEASRERVATPQSPARGHASTLRSSVLDIQAEELARLRTAGEISAATFRQMQHQLDVEHARLTGETS